MKRIGIVAKRHDDFALKTACELSTWLQKKELHVFVTPQIANHSDAQSVPLVDMPKHVELMVVLGGDGTLLQTGRCFVGSGVPILGINLGRLGFLTDTPLSNMFDVMDEVLAGQFKVKKHFALQVDVIRDGSTLSSGLAMNDVVLQRNDHPRMIEFEMYARKQFVFRLRADGLVLATPAGSTAYALSAGGAIVHPEIEAISVVPICPHTVSNRPIILPSYDEIKLNLIDSPAPAALNLDGQVHSTLNLGDQVCIKRTGDITLVYLEHWHYFEVLRNKLGWAGQQS
ncbi:NAD(+)/NADH kinase [Ghiorsea bivora]|uniref:NAD(+)/NADH kinase n=1 Tax=Ghiorsea bivora TaxID=1485545 RepID=UPI0005705698|nr:NAD(+)/NADH kinase [Ghiorsea bivora]